MSFNWSWKEQTSSVEVKCTNGTWRECKIYNGNGLAIIIMEFDDNTYQVVSFMIDKQHAVNCFESDVFRDYRNWKINGNCKNAKTLSSILTRFRVDHEIYFNPF